MQYGDIFDENTVLNPLERKNIVIPVNRCFDTLVDNDLISANTLHGMAMQQFYASNRFNTDTLNNEIQHILAPQQAAAETLRREDKRSGNLKRYPAGTIAEIRYSQTCTYFFLGMSAFDQTLHAHTSDEEYIQTLTKLLLFCNTRSQHYPVIMPLIGAGSTSKSERDILEFLVKLIQLHQNTINSDIYIVVRDNGRENIPITDLT